MSLIPTHGELERIARDTGWDGHMLLLLISRWLEGEELSYDLLDHLSDLAVQEE